MPILSTKMGPDYSSSAEEGDGLNNRLSSETRLFAKVRSGVLRLLISLIFLSREGLEWLIFS